MIPASVHRLTELAALWLAFTAPAMLAWRLPIALLTRIGYRQGWLVHRIGVYGVNETTREYIEDVEQQGDGFGRVFGLYDDRIERIGSLHAGLRIDGSSPALLRANSERPFDELQALQKSVFDRAVAALALLVLSPLLALIALLVKLDSPGPVFFRQPRTGLNDRMFLINKFRTMRHESADLGATRQTSRHDDRITKVGAVLRRLSIDELPQLINVLQGDMSLVGPRPHAPNTAVDGQPLEIVFADYVFRHRVKPGITGWAQVNRARGELRTAEDVRRRVEHDLYYIENWSLTFDVRILLLTFAREIVSSRAY